MSALETSSPTNTSPPVRKRRWWLVVLFWLGISAISFLLVGSALCGVFLWNAKQELAVEIAHVRASGAPLTSVELNESYQPEPGKRDITDEFINALAIFDDADLWATGATLPYVGAGDKPESTAADWPQLEEAKVFLERHRALLQFVETLEDQDVTVRFPTDLSLGLLARLEHQLQLVQVVKLLRLQLRVDWFEQRRERTVNCLRQQIVLANLLQHDPPAVAQLVRNAMFGIACTDLEWAIGNVQLPDEDWQQLQLAFRSLNGLESLALMLDGERAIDYTTCTWPLAAVEHQATSNREYVDKHLAAGPQRPWDCALLLAYFRRIEHAADQSYYSALQEGEAVSQDLRTLLRSRRQRLYIYTGLMTPPVPLMIKSSARQAARTAATDAGIAVVRYRHAHAEWPTQLADLVPEYLPELPVDPFSDQPLLVAAVNDEFKVYSVGENGIDDGGTWDEEDSADVGFAVTAK